MRKIKAAYFQYSQFNSVEVAIRNRSFYLANSYSTYTGIYLQALQYLRKVCDHPKLVLDATHPEWPAVERLLANTNSTLDDIQHSAKLPALQVNT